MDLQQEEKFVLAAQKDPEAFGVLFDHYYPKILSYLVRRTCDVVLAQDLTSETFIKAFSKLWQFRWRSIAFSAWLYRIAGNELRMHFRGKRPVFSLDSLTEQGFDAPDQEHFLDELQVAQEAVDRHGEFLQVQSQLKTLPLHYQEVIALRFFEEKSLKEIAEILGKREGTVKSLLSRGLALLRNCNLLGDDAL